MTLKLRKLIKNKTTETNTKRLKFQLKTKQQQNLKKTQPTFI